MEPRIFSKFFGLVTQSSNSSLRKRKIGSSFEKVHFCFYFKYTWKASSLVQRNVNEKYQSLGFFQRNQLINSAAGKIKIGPSTKKDINETEHTFESVFIYHICILRYVFTVSLDVGSLQLNVLRMSRKYSSQLKDTRSERSPRVLTLRNGAHACEPTPFCGSCSHLLSEQCFEEKNILFLAL